jgi:hypothetical protein
MDELLSIQKFASSFRHAKRVALPLARACLAAGRDVLVDKPFTTTLVGHRARGIHAENRAACSPFIRIAVTTRFSAIVQLVASGALGRIVRFESNYDRFRPQLRPAPGASAPPRRGILISRRTSSITRYCWNAGSATADIRIEREGAVTDDAFDLAFHYPRGLRVVAFFHSRRCNSAALLCMERKARSSSNPSIQKATPGSHPTDKRGARNRKKIGPADPLCERHADAARRIPRRIATIATSTPTCATRSSGKRSWL